MTMMQGLPLTGVSVSVTAKKRGEACLSICSSHIKTMHKLLASLYDGLENDDVYDDDFDDNVQIESGDSARLTQIFADHCYKLVKIMTEPTNGPVELPLSQMVTVLTRCLNISYSDVLSVPSRTDLATLLPQLHQCCMDVLAQLILCCGRDTLLHSRVIIDLCLQTILCAGKMPFEHKCVTRSSAYQTLVLWIQTCGWGSYLSSHRKVLIGELLVDTQAVSQDRLAKKTDDPKFKHNKFSSKKKSERKKGRKGDSYMELEVKEGAEGKEQNSEEMLDLVHWAFSLSQQAVENLPFSTAQNLISHLVKTASTVQRLSLSRPEPYTQMQARKGLYQALASCLLSPLDYGCNRNDAVSHYQMTNTALDLLVRASHREDSEIQSLCSQALAILKSSSKLKGPVIRKVLDYDDSGVEDVSQLLREKEQMSDCVEDLRHKLMNSEMENEQQSRLISSLREQMIMLQNKVSSVNEQPDSVNAASRLPQWDQKINDDQGSDRKETKHDYDDNDVHDNSDEQDNDHISIDHLEEAEKIVTHWEPTTSKRCITEINTNEGTKIFSKRASASAETPLDKDPKRPKIDQEEKDNNRIEEMLMDFVDAPPDS